MKTKYGILFGFAALLLAAIFTLAGCGNLVDPLGNGGDTLEGSVSIAGNPTEGQTLYAIPSLDGTGTISYQWKAGNTGIGDAASYVLTSEEVGKTITVTVTRAGYSGSKTSAATDEVESASAGTALEGTVSITGTNVVGQTLTADITSLGGTGGTISYQWKAGGAAISGATNATYELTDTEIGKTITVTVRRTGYSGSISSSATAVVVGDDGTNPVLKGTVSISGTAKVGETLTADTTALEIEETETISYQWKASGVNIGTGASTYVLMAAETGKTITLTVTVAGYIGSISSAAKEVIAVGDDAGFTGSVSISGKAQVGETLTAHTTASGTPAYQWKANNSNIGWATGVSYELTAAELGKTITVTVTVNGKSKTSQATAAVIAIAGSDNPQTADDVFTGTWTSEGGDQTPPLKIVAESGTFTYYLLPYNIEVIHGTYTCRGAAVTAKIVEVNTMMFGGDDAWVAWASLSSTYKGYMGNSQTQTFTISNDSFTMSNVGGNMTFTKGDGNGGEGEGNKLIISNISAPVLGYINAADPGDQIGVFARGTTTEQALSGTGLVAGANLYDGLKEGGIVIAGSTMTISLYVPSTGKPWTGNETVEIYVGLFSTGHFYSASAVEFTSGTATVVFGTGLTEIVFGGDEGGEEGVSGGGGPLPGDGGDPGKTPTSKLTVAPAWKFF
jgi:hypothetical protein